MSSTPHSHHPPHPHPHSLSSSEQAYIQQLPPQQRDLHILATQKLGSSYFVKWTHGFKKWISTQQTKVTPDTQSQGVK